LKKADVGVNSQRDNNEDSFTPQPISRKLQSEYDRILSLLNVHAGLYLVNNAQDYATVMNCNVLTEKLKHKYDVRMTVPSRLTIDRFFKTMADTAAPSNLMSYLFIKNVIK